MHSKDGFAKQRENNMYDIQLRLCPSVTLGLQTFTATHNYAYSLADLHSGNKPTNEPKPRTGLYSQK